MSDDEMNGTKIDGLLKKVFKDDLPPETEQKMRRRLLQFREAEKRGHTLNGILGRLLLPRIGSWLRWIPAREVLAFSSLFMICLGGFLHVSGHRNAMADTLSFLSTSVSVSDQLLRVTSMECMLRVSKGNEEHLKYTIRWLSPEMVRVDLRRGEDTNKTLWITDSAVVVTDRIRNTPREYTSLDQVEDPLFEPALEFLAPAKISEAIYGKWVPKQYGEPHDGERLTLAYMNGEEKVLVEMTVDSTTSLPVSIKKFPSDSGHIENAADETLEAGFVWNSSISPRLMIPKS